MEGAPYLFEDRRRKTRAEENNQEELFEQIGRLKTEVERFKRNLDSSVDARRGLVEPRHAVLSIRRQCELLGVARGSWYYEPVAETTANLKLMRRIDEMYLKRPYFGRRRIGDELNVNRKRAQPTCTAPAGQRRRRGVRETSHDEWRQWRVRRAA